MEELCRAVSLAQSTAEKLSKASATGLPTWPSLAKGEPRYRGPSPPVEASTPGNAKFVIGSPTSPFLLPLSPVMSSGDPHAPSNLFPPSQQIARQSSLKKGKPTIIGDGRTSLFEEMSSGSVPQSPQNVKEGSDGLPVEGGAEVPTSSPQEQLEGGVQVGGSREETLQGGSHAEPVQGHAEQYKRSQKVDLLQADTAVERWLGVSSLQHVLRLADEHSGATPAGPRLWGLDLSDGCASAPLDGSAVSPRIPQGLPPLNVSRPIAISPQHGAVEHGAVSTQLSSLLLTDDTSGPPASKDSGSVQMQRPSQVTYKHQGSSAGSADVSVEGSAVSDLDDVEVMDEDGDPGRQGQVAKKDAATTQCTAPAGAGVELPQQERIGTTEVGDTDQGKLKRDREGDEPAGGVQKEGDTLMDEQDRLLLLAVSRDSSRPPKSPKREPHEWPGLWVHRVGSEGNLTGAHQGQEERLLCRESPLRGEDRSAPGRGMTIDDGSATGQTLFSAPGQPIPHVNAESRSLPASPLQEFSGSPLQQVPQGAHLQLGPPALGLATEGMMHRAGTGDPRLERWLVRQKRQKQREKERQNLLKWLQEEQQRESRAGPSQESKKSAAAEAKAKPSAQKQKGRGAQQRSTASRKAAAVPVMEQWLSPAMSPPMSPSPDPQFGASTPPRHRPIGLSNVVPIRPAPISPKASSLAGRPTPPPVIIPQDTRPQYEGRLVQLWNQFQQHLRQHKQGQGQQPLSPVGPLQSPQQSPRTPGWSPPGTIPYNSSLPNLSALAQSPTLSLSPPGSSPDITSLSRGSFRAGTPSSGDTLTMFKAAESDTKSGVDQEAPGGPHHWRQMQAQMVGGATPQQTPHLFVGAQASGGQMWGHPAAAGQPASASGMWQWAKPEGIPPPAPPQGENALGVWRPWSQTGVPAESANLGPPSVGGIVPTVRGEGEGSSWLNREISLSSAAAQLLPLEPVSESREKVKSDVKFMGLSQEEILGGPGSVSSNRGRVSEPDTTLRL